jgi:hypothetical protein
MAIIDILMKKSTARKKTAAQEKSPKSTLWFYIVAFSILLTIGYFVKSDLVPATAPTNDTSSVEGISTSVDVPEKKMHVYDISMTQSSNEAAQDTVSISVRVVNRESREAILGADVSALLYSPKGALTNLTGNTNAEGIVTFVINSAEKGTFTVDVINVGHNDYEYYPNTTKAALLVQ